MNFTNQGIKLGVPLACLVGVVAMYFVLGGCEESKNRSCVGAMLAMTSGCAGGYDQYCKDGGDPKRESYFKEITGPNGWLNRRKCPKGGTYTIETTESTDLDSPKAYRVVCSAHGDLAKAKTTIDKDTYERLKSMLPIATRPD